MKAETHRTNLALTLSHPFIRRPSGLKHEMVLDSREPSRPLFLVAGWSASGSVGHRALRSKVKGKGSSGRGGPARSSSSTTTSGASGLTVHHLLRDTKRSDVLHFLNSDSILRNRRRPPSRTEAPITHFLFVTLPPV